MQTITLSLKLHRGEERIFAEFPNNKKLNDAVKQVPGARWSQSNRRWHFPPVKESVAALKQTTESLATVDTSTLKKQLEEKKRGSVVRLPRRIESAQPAELIPKKIRTYNYKNKSIHGVNAHVLPAMDQQLKLKAYSPSTIRTYLNEMAQLLQRLGDIPADELQPLHLKRYLVYCFEKLGLKENTLHSRINALKFYYEQVLGREDFFWEIPRPKKQLILPKVLSEAELGKLFRAIENIKHKAIVFTAYSAGLRVSEVVNLKIKDVDSNRMTLFIERAKGKKDRVVNLSPLLLDILRSYLQKCDRKPEVYLFEGEIPGEPYSARSAQLIFHDARKKAGIQKEISFHGLRHSFATHLLEKGVDIRYIKDILGHFDIKTTERYTHVSKRMLVNIGSPLDDLAGRGYI